MNMDSLTCVTNCESDQGLAQGTAAVGHTSEDAGSQIADSSWATDQRQQRIQVMQSIRMELDYPTGQPDASSSPWKQSNSPSYHVSTSDDPETPSAARFYAMALNHGLDQVNAGVQGRIKSIFPSMFNQPVRNDDFTAVCRNCRAALDIIS
ncbi:hypothetical protein INS49_011989 [Diaporthe citri]|uniref:uncharacterized protein n=1 Tax=Diaporthe citri TaxID=83186 RepID=UPI001C7F324A|nr:uncharacterized protein INS49_011989 [Diaporthe citri]KAG6360921.1 hypothetical protein INS49_011989 [Diaporthe citri]